MRQRTWIVRIGLRVGALVIVLAAYSLLLVLDARRSFLLDQGASGPGVLWLRLGLSVLTSLLYLAVGACVWLFARQRAVARLIFAFCAAVALCFACETAAAANDRSFGFVSFVGACTGMYLLAVLLLVFPHNYFLQAARGAGTERSRPWWIVRLYLLFQSLLVVVQVAAVVGEDLGGIHSFLYQQGETITTEASLLALGCALVQVVIAYRGAIGSRERQQMRLLVAGLFLALVPFLILSLLPDALGLHPETVGTSQASSYLVDTQITTGTLPLFALALGYAALRYQLLVMDRSVRRAATVLVAGMALFILLYLVVILLGTTLTGEAYAIGVAALTALLVAFVPHLAAKAVERLFYREFAAHQRHLLDPDLFTREGIDFEKAADLLAVAVMETFGVTAVALYILDEEHETYRAIRGRATMADAPQEQESARAELVRRVALAVCGESQASLAQGGEPDVEVAGWIHTHADRLLQAKRPLLASQLALPSSSTAGNLARYFNKKSEADGHDTGLLVVPVRAQGQLIGVLLLQRGSEQPWAGPDFEVMRLLLAGFAPVLSNCLLAERALRLEAVAATDPLTRLPNHRALLECCDRELERGRRFGRKVSILFMDGDHFKRVNDRHGHAVGDTVLREIGERARSALRAGDTLGRYGGEEFAVILPETDAEQAGVVAERIRVAVAAFPLATSLVEGGGIPVTVSIGLASFPDDGGTSHDILDMADQAMYWAKRLGRNQLRTPVDVQRARHNAALVAATAASLERRGEEGAPGIAVEEAEKLLRADQAVLVYSLMRILELRDHGISSHSYQVSDLAAAVAQEMGLDAPQKVEVATAGLLHDIGKVGIPDAILQKSGPLTPSERDLIRSHPEMSAQILEESTTLNHLAPAVRAHHERWDGNGYPGHIGGIAIPLAARIIGVAEAYQAMLADRPYQAARSKEDAQAELARCAGTHFDPRVVEAALAVLARELAPREAPEPAEYQGA